jgi:hypothetical protein
MTEPERDSNIKIAVNIRLPEERRGQRHRKRGTTYRGWGPVQFIAVVSSGNLPCFDFVYGKVFAVSIIPQ